MAIDLTYSQAAFGTFQCGLLILLVLGPQLIFKSRFQHARPCGRNMVRLCCTWYLVLLVYLSASNNANCQSIYLPRSHCNFWKPYQVRPGVAFFQWSCVAPRSKLSRERIFRQASLPSPCAGSWSSEGQHTLDLRSSHIPCSVPSMGNRMNIRSHERKWGRTLQLWFKSFHFYHEICQLTWMQRSLLSDISWMSMESCCKIGDISSDMTIYLHAMADLVMQPRKETWNLNMTPFEEEVWLWRSSRLTNLAPACA